MSHLLRCILLVSLLGNLFLSASSQVAPDGNTACLKCHSSHSFSLYNDWTERDEKRLMNPFYILDTVLLNTGVHNSFKCIDCHSYEYETYPHNGELKLEPLMTCIDCHGGDETYASFQFERVEEEFQKSVHFDLHEETFTCSKCHSQHYYKATARTSDNILDIVEFSNNMCLSCHDSKAHYQLLSDNEVPELVQIHDWLPNQKLHFDRVRCIECHTDVVDSLMVSHNILPKEKATKDCVQCHSGNSILQASLYKYQNLSSRSADGKINTILSNQSYVIGAYQNTALNMVLLLILMGTLGGIITHAIFRIRKK